MGVGRKVTGAARAGIGLLAVLSIGLVDVSDAAGDGLDPANLRWSRARPDLILSVKTARPVVALSFDDGPDPRYTPAVLAVLAEAGARATFFLQGSHVAAEPGLARRIAAAGHEVGNHTYTHPSLPDLDRAATAREVLRTSRALQAARVPEAMLFRPPKGRYAGANAAAVRSLHRRAVGWDVCVEAKLRGRTDEEAVAAVLASVEPGSIILAHDGGIPNRDRTLAVLPALLRGLRARGFDVVTIGELLREA